MQSEAHAGSRRSAMHDCPQCGQACYCSGDIEDHDVGPEFDDVCECCQFDACAADDDDVFAEDEP